MKSKDTIYVYIVWHGMSLFWLTFDWSLDISNEKNHIRLLHIILMGLKTLNCLCVMCIVTWSWRWKLEGYLQWWTLIYRSDLS